MEKIKTIFCSADSTRNQTELMLHANLSNQICIKISGKPCNQFIVLDLKTAIKLSKHLRKEISIVMGKEAQNG